MGKVITKSRTGGVLILTGILLALFSTSVVSAAVDTSSCDGMGEKTPAQIILKQTCYVQLAKSSKDGSVCSGAPDPTSCITGAAAELESPELITVNIEGEARKMALVVYASLVDPDALDLIKDNRIPLPASLFSY